MRKLTHVLAHISLTKFVCMHANFPLSIIHVHPTLGCTISMIKALWFIFHHLTTGRVQTLIYSLILLIVLAQRWVWHFSAECLNVFLIGAGLWATQCFTHASLWNWEHVCAKKHKQMFATKHVQVVADKPPMHMTCINSSRATCFWN